MGVPGSWVPRRRKHCFDAKFFLKHDITISLAHRAFPEAEKYASLRVSLAHFTNTTCRRSFSTIFSSPKSTCRSNKHSRKHNILLHLKPSVRYDGNVRLRIWSILETSRIIMQLSSKKHPFINHKSGPCLNDGIDFYHWISSILDIIANAHFKRIYAMASL